MLKVRTLFSGIGSPESALDRLKIPYEIVDFCENDKYAIKSYCAIHGIPESKNLGDITKVWGRNLPYADLLVWGFPCTDISVAGKQKGIIEGSTRSGLYYEGLRVLKETKPKYSVIENVKNLTGKKFKAEFEQMLSDIGEIGYNNYWKVLNAKNYGIPQNRERVFIVSIRKDIDTGKFEFTEGFDNGLRLKDFLEDEVDEKFYISQVKTEKLLLQLKDKNSLLLDMCQGRVYSEDGIAPTIMSNSHIGGYTAPKILQVGTIDGKNYNQNKVVYNTEGIAPTIQGQGHCGNEPKILQVGMLDIRGNEQIRRVYSEEGLSPTLNTMGGGNRQPKVLTLNTKDESGKESPQQDRVYDTNGVMTAISAQLNGRFNILEPKVIIDDIYKNREPRVYPENCCTLRDYHAGDLKTITSKYRIRKLTPKECWRLMGFTDEEFQKAVNVGISNSQLYKQAGNSIVTNVLVSIFEKLLQSDIMQNIESEKELS